MPGNQRVSRWPRADNGGGFVGAVKYGWFKLPSRLVRLIKEEDSEFGMEPLNLVIRWQRPTRFERLRPATAPTYSIRSALLRRENRSE